VKSIVFAQYTNPAGYPPLEHAARILADAGWRVLFLGTKSYTANELTFPPHPNVGVRLLRFQPPGWRQKLHYLWFVAWCVGVTAARQPAAVYCSDQFSTPVGLAVWFLFRIPVVYHEHDTPGPPPNRFLALVGLARRRLAKTAVTCVIPNEQRREKLNTELRPRRSVCVWNCPTRDEVLPARDQPTGVFTLWYHGSLTPGQFPLTVIDALAQLPESVRLRFAGYETVGHVGFVRELRERAERVGIRHRVEYVGTPPTRAELYALAATADVGLTLFARQFREPMAGASNKPFDYLACGLALLVTDTPEWTGLYAGCSRSANPDSAESIATAVRKWLADPESARTMGDIGRRRVLAEWNYETQFEPVKRLLEGL
jgi:glycosyltransferase involved in cell wall biosynthesis